MVFLPLKHILRSKNSISRYSALQCDTLTIFDVHITLAHKRTIAYIKHLKNGTLEDILLIFLSARDVLNKKLIL